jgi:hypothetical protein
MRFLRRKLRTFCVSIEFAGRLPGPARHLATSPEIFRIVARSKRSARRDAVAYWTEKYQAPPALITKLRVYLEGERLEPGANSPA